MNKGTCVLCDNKGEYELMELDGCIGRVCLQCRENIVKYGVKYAEKAAAEKAELNEIKGVK